MKQLNTLKLAGSFREISDVLEIISGIIRIFAVVLMIMQSVLLIKNVKTAQK